MNLQEFSTEFDVLYDNITSNQAPGLNEYEKSVFLTKAQAQLVNEYFNARTDGYGGGFDGSEKRQYDFSGLIRVETLFDINTFKERIDSTEKLDRRSRVFLFPQNYFLAVNEIISDSKRQYSVLPLNYGEYQRLMLKPYNFPVKRGVWRILTDKKNCNYTHEDVDGNFIEDLSASSDYKILSSWADQKRKLQIILKYSRESWDSEDEQEFSLGPTEIKFLSDNGYYAKITADCGWDTDNKDLYKVELTVITSNGDHDDETIFNVLKEGFSKVKSSGIYNPNLNYDTIKAITHTDGFIQASAPSKYTTIYDNFISDSGGRVFTLKVIQLPMAEIIGKFEDDVQYQLRYVRNLNPIILEDLDNYGDDLTIGGIVKATECTLPEETHQEILERAVTLAKIAWQGATSTQAAAQQRQRNND